MTGLLRPSLFLAMLASATAVLAGFLGFVHPFFDTLSNFRLHLSVLLGLLAVLWLLRCSRIPALLFALVAFAGIAGSTQGLPLRTNPARALPSEPVYRLFVMNLRWSNPAPQKVVASVARHDPDIIMLTEYSPSWARRLAGLEAEYPHAFRCPTVPLVHGSLILSRVPMVRDGDFCGEESSLVLTTAMIGGRPVSLGMVHLRWPWPASGPRQIGQLSPVLAAIGPDAIVAGDFNSASWTHSVERFHRAGRLRAVDGIGPTWGPNLKVGGLRLQWPQWLGLPIDNAAVKGAVDVVSVRTLAPAGSDHLPVLLEFVVR